MSRVAKGLSLVAGGAVSTRSGPAGFNRLPSGLGEAWRLPTPSSPTLSELFAAHPRDAGWAGFLLAQVDASKPVLWVQDRMAVRESGRIHPPGLPGLEIIHIEARDARSALWAMEEGLRCTALSSVIGEIWGDPTALDFTASRRLAVASERSRIPCWLVRLGGTANLSGARMRWRITSLPSLIHAFDPNAPGSPVWDVELFRARSGPPGRWSIAYEADRFHLAATPGDRTLGEDERLTA